MEPELARRLFAEGAVLVLLDVPQRTEFGIDYNSWSVGPKFKGVKMIPPGLHFVYYCAVSKQGDAAPRTGFFHFFKRQEVLVMKWDHKTEDLTDEGISTEMVERIRAGLKDLDQGLGPYPYDTLKKWVSLSNHISQDLVTRIQPLSGKVTSVSQIVQETSAVGSGEGEREGGREREVTGEREGGGEREESGGGEREVTGEMEGGGEKEEGEREGRGYGGGRFAGVGDFEPSVDSTSQKRRTDLPLFKSKPETALRFSEVPRQRHPVGASPSEISHHCMDLSYTLQSLMTSNHTHYRDLLGELQLAFLCFFLAHVYDAFEHWKELVRLLCMSESALSDQTELFTNFITVLHFQLKEIPDDFFVDIVSRSNFLTTTLQVFFACLEQGSSLDSRLVKKGLQFRDNLTKQYNWDFSSEPDEYAPTIVDTDCS
ncbi:Protein AAR2 homolog [Geodia barretti]|uniref:Protein AAR2 homolog n=2 Tax=Geodia barretti TaxID=519541 RepID=A0AA35RM87_GEOBA|nr:Protein AAR2 homolog [Geodia barretti]